VRVIEPISKREFEVYYNLRYELLRKPWNQPLGSERDNNEDSSFHRMILDDNNNALAVGRIQFISDKKAQIRYMAVSTSVQRKGLGSAILLSLEKIAVKSNINSIILQARNNSINFYKSNGYVVVKKTFRLFDEIQHWLMQKNINR
tara:strand:+ start:445 stop:882 length:438 start_codon:yes stop_codon:yes gene_type:complete